MEGEKRGLFSLAGLCSSRSPAVREGWLLCYTGVLAGRLGRAIGGGIAGGLRGGEEWGGGEGERTWGSYLCRKSCESLGLLTRAGDL